MDGRLLGLVALPLLLGCGRSEGTVVIDGSSTVFPIVNVMADDFGSAHPDLKIVVNKSGTGGGIQKFARGEVDIATASRPIEPPEAAELRKAGVDYVEIPIAYDGVTVVVHPSNPVASLSVSQLRLAWRGDVSDWGRLGGAAGGIAFYGPTANHGTWETFARAVGGRLRSDVQTEQDYNVVVRSVAGDRNAMGYVGFDYYLQNRTTVKAVAIDGVLPSAETISSGKYAHLARPLFLIVSRSALARAEVRDFVEFALGPGGRSAVTETQGVPLRAEALVEARRQLAAAVPISHVAGR